MQHEIYFAADFDSRRNKKCYAEIFPALCALCDFGSDDFSGNDLCNANRIFRTDRAFCRNDFGVVRSKFIPRCRYLLRDSFCT